MSYLFLFIVIPIAFNERLYQVKRAKSFREGFSSLFPQISNTLKGDLGPLIFLPGNNLKNVFLKLWKLFHLNMMSKISSDSFVPSS